MKDINIKEWMNSEWTSKPDSDFKKLSRANVTVINSDVFQQWLT